MGIYRFARKIGLFALSAVMLAAAGVSVSGSVNDTALPVCAVSEQAIVTLDKTQMSVGLGETVKLNAVVKSNNIEDNTLAWRTSDPKVLTVDNNGNVKTVSTGVAWITVKTGTGKEKSCKITVKNAPSKVSMTMGSLSLGVGESFSIGSIVNDGAASAKRTYRTSNSSIVKMTRTDWKGEFIGVKPGIAYVTVRTYNGKEASCKITVKKAPKTVTLTKGVITLGVGEKFSIGSNVDSGAAAAKRT